MTNPTHLITLPDGRELAVDEHGGETDGPVVLFLHSAPGSRVLDPDPAATAAAGVRLLTLDRPGYGASSPLPGDVVPTVAALADNVAFALGALGAGEVAVAGWSGGGRIALGLAARHPALVRSAALIATPAPDDKVPWVGEEFRGPLRAMRAEPEKATGLMSGMFAAQGPPGTESVAGGAADDAVLQDPDRRQRLERMLAEAFRNGPAGIAADIVADQVSDWGFDPAAVSAPVTLFYGDADIQITPEHGRYWAATLADAELRIVPGAGHLLVLTAWGDILEALSRQPRR